MIGLIIMALFLLYCISYSMITSETLADRFLTVFVICLSLVVSTSIYSSSLSFGDKRIELEQRIRSISENSSELEIKLLKEDIEDFNKYLFRHQKQSKSIWIGAIISDSVNKVKPISYD